MNNDFKIINFSLLTAKEANNIDNKFLKYDDLWWLRSPGDEIFSAVFVSNVGNIYPSGHLVNDSYFAVRPALYFKSNHFQVGDKIKIGKYKFNVIANGIALIDGDIGYSQFDIGYSENYENATIKEIVNSFFEKEILPNIQNTEILKKTCQKISLES